MSNVQVIQDKAYFEVKVCKAGDILVGSNVQETVEHELGKTQRAGALSSPQGRPLATE
jgi:hypothetical protein